MTKVMRLNPAKTPILGSDRAMMIATIVGRSRFNTDVQPSEDIEGAWDVIAYIEDGNLAEHHYACEIFTSALIRIINGSN
jgi:hypothetical protein